MQNKLVVYDPKQLGSFTEEIANKINELGLDETGMRTLNVERYINKLQRLQMDGLQLSIMPEQTKEMVLTAIYQNPTAIQFASIQDEHSKTIVINKNPDLISCIHEPTDVDIQMAIDLKPSSILFAKTYTKEQAKKAIEKEIGLVFKINKSFIDEEMMMFVLDLVKEDKEKLNFFYDQHLPHKSSFFHSPLNVFNNEKIQRYAFSISPMFLNFIKPSLLKKEQIIAILKETTLYYDVICKEEYVLDKSIALTLAGIYLGNDRSYGVPSFYNIFTLLDYECLHAYVIKEIIDVAREKAGYTASFYSVWRSLESNLELLM